MENFVVSARKYRPTRFSEVVGQESVTNTLKNAIKTDHLGQSFLFCGPRGVGKTTCARILAKTINCQNITEGFEACGTCNSCQSFKDNSSFNIFELDAASNSHVDDIRGLIEQVRFAPQAGKYKIYIIDEVHMLSQSAFNAFLKTLEEPPPYAIFILATTEKHKIIPTILSRCQIYDFNRIFPNNVANYLQEICQKENITAAYDALHLIGQKADGALRDALSIFDRIVSFAGGNITYKDVIQNLNILDYDYYFKVTDSCVIEDVSSVLLTFNEILRNGFEGDDFLLGLGDHFRNLLVCQDQATLELLEVSDQLKERYQKQAELVPVAFLLNALQIINTADTAYKTSKNKRLHVEMALIKICYINAAVQMGENGDPVKKNFIKPEIQASKPYSNPENKNISTAAEGESAFSSNHDETDEADSPSSEESGSTTVESNNSTNETAASTTTKEQESSTTQPETGPIEGSGPETLDSNNLEHQQPENEISKEAPTESAPPKDVSPEKSPTATPSSPPAEPVITKKPGTFLPDTVQLTSIDAIKAQVKKQAAQPSQSDASEAAKEEEIAVNQEALKITNEELSDHWNAYKESIREKSPSMAALMDFIQPVVDHNRIKVPVENQLQLEKFEEFKQEISIYIRTQLNIEQLIINFVVDKNLQSPTTNKPYTSSDKFKKMAEKEPLLKEFQKRFNLDLDY